MTTKDPALLYQIVKKLAPKAYQQGITVKLNDELEDAQSVWQTKTIEVGTTLFEKSNQQDLEAMTAHEIGHIALRHLNRSELFEFKLTRVQVALILLAIVSGFIPFVFFKMPFLGVLWINIQWLLILLVIAI